METATTSTVIALFADREAAERAVNALKAEGYLQDNISVISGDSPTAAESVPNIGPVATAGSFDAATGASIGGLAGFVGGILLLAVPGIGPILAAGPIAAGIMGAGLGAATGGLIGGLKEHGVPEDDAHHVAEAIHAGRTMVAVHVPHDRAAKAADILDDNDALDTTDVEGDVTGRRGVVTPISPTVPRALDAVRLSDDDSLVQKQRGREQRSGIYPGITGSSSGPTS